MATSRRHTVNLLHEDAAKPETPSAASGPVVGLLVTYTWDPAGRIYPLRAGLNRIGASPECEVSVPEDDALSSMHASIRFRRKFLINDLDSENGTEVNNTSVDEVYLRLANYARIKTGNTVWTFIIIDPPLDDGQAEQS